MTPEDETTVTASTGASTGMTSRRQALKAMGSAVSAGVVGATMPTLNSQGPAAPAIFTLPTPPPILVPASELVSLFKYEEQARIALGPTKAAPILGSDRTITDRITLRARTMIPTLDMDLTCPLLGDDHFTPIIVGPIADQNRFHADGEVATARGASAARAAMVVSSDSSVPLATIAAAVRTPLWLQVYPKSSKAKDLLAAASAARAKVVVVTVNAGAAASGTPVPAAPIDWAAVEAIVKGTSLPVIVKGIARPADAKEAVARGAKGVVVSNYRGGNEPALPGTLLLIRPVVEAVGAQVPVLADGSFRYGSDVLKALAFGAKAVLIGRPVMWGLSAYGAEGVQGVVETLQTDFARFMGMCGLAKLANINSTVARVHAPLPSVTKR